MRLNPGSFTVATEIGTEGTGDSERKGAFYKGLTLQAVFVSFLGNKIGLTTSDLFFLPYHNFYLKLPTSGTNSLLDCPLGIG